VTTPVYTDSVTGRRTRVLKNEWDGWGGTLGVDWRPDPDTLVYAKYTRGYKAGGFNSATTTLVGAPFSLPAPYRISGPPDCVETERTNPLT
jgi:outer membrane receptor protein involved in Fe transport